MLDKAILERLEALLLLSIPPVPRSAKETNEVKVLRLCDFQHSREDISKEVKISLNQVDVILNGLRKTGRIVSLSKDGTKVYLRLRSEP